MRILLALILFTALSACAGSGPIALPDGFQPLAQDIEIGSEAIKDAASTEIQRHQLIGRGVSATIVVTTTAKVSAESNEGKISLSLRYLDTWVVTQNVPAREAAAFDKSEIYEGTLVDVVYDQKTAVSSVSVTRGGKTTTTSETITGILGQFFTEFVFSGRSVGPDRQILKFNLARFLGAEHVPANLDVVGVSEAEGTLDGRDVIAVRLTGSADLDGRKTTVDGLHFLDIRSGYYIGGEIRIFGLRYGTTTSNLTLEQKLVL